ncbi:MAG: TRIC cation channel family protein [Clostridia bacterium]|nr:TRIC cation channel family protein [Clostridia bacterium]
MIFFLEIIGTIAFAISGAVVGIQKKMDVFGVTILAMATAVGGGIIRDVILSVTPPAAFRAPVYALSAFGVGIAVFIIEAAHLFENKPKSYDTVLLWMDSIGLGIFTVSGMQAASSAVEGANAFLLVSVGVITGVGGGILRDVLAKSIPFIFVKHFYATASIIGAVVCVVLWRFWDEVPSMFVSAGLIVALRIIAARYRWKLPRIK